MIGYGPQLGHIHIPSVLIVLLVFGLAIYSIYSCEIQKAIDRCYSRYTNDKAKESCREFEESLRGIDK